VTVPQPVLGVRVVFGERARSEPAIGIPVSCPIVRDPDHHVEIMVRI
jgi:hypothetical protein